MANKGKTPINAGRPVYFSYARNNDAKPEWRHIADCVDQLIVKLRLPTLISPKNLRVILPLQRKSVQKNGFGLLPRCYCLLGWAMFITERTGFRLLLHRAL